jgi:phosphoribosylaminoimidazole-succinocarboxamide synthase
MENGFQGHEGQQVPEMTEEIIGQISERYIELYEVVTGKTFQKHDVNHEEEQKKLEEAIKQLH